ncbi:dethiobiotin synthase [Propionivibrio sp.]|uniref:dethiobiotin synthase n=1 Tax=Propionivibrio sp. TaxID=2212460 RepID=UPI00262F212C|nr:dethiobiotin synthase [Propionivibrio sp.]
MNPPIKPAWFVTGTDTEVGKTFVACALLHALRNKGVAAIGMKPVAAGTDAEGRNADVEALLAASGGRAPRELVNPYLFNPAIAPHIAAVEAGRRIELACIVAAFEALLGMADALLVEGVGGFCVPLGPQLSTADLAERLQLPVILVVGMRLGCINHALLSQQAIAARGLKLAGWVANRTDPQMSHFEENLAALTERMASPLLGVIPSKCTPEKAAKLIRLPEC